MKTPRGWNSRRASYQAVPGGAPCGNVFFLNTTRPKERDRRIPTGQRLTGKVESALGSLVGSTALKEKGAQKEQEANTIKLQGRELAEAERLEAEALMRRERAVAHGKLFLQAQFV